MVLAGHMRHFGLLNIQLIRPAHGINVTRARVDDFALLGDSGALCEVVRDPLLFTAVLKPSLRL